MLLQSPIIQLRAPELADLDFMFHIENDTRLWLVSSCKVPYSRFQIQQYIESNAHDIYADKQLRLMIEHRVSGEVVGIVIDAPYRCKGFAAESLRLLATYARRVLQLNQLYAKVLAEHQIARKLFKRCGYSEVATLPQWVFSEGCYKDVCVYQCVFEK